MSTEELARAMHDSDPWPTLKLSDGRKLPHQKWDGCNDEHRRRYMNLAERLADE